VIRFSDLSNATLSFSTPLALVRRARIILLAGDGLGVKQTAQELGIRHKAAGNWSHRWRGADDGAEVAARLAGAPRPGASAKFTPEAICQVIALVCQDPETLGTPVSHWSQGELVRQSVVRSIIGIISHGSVGRFFRKEADLKLHRNRYWLTPKPDPGFDAKYADICAACQAAPAAAEQADRIVSIDEMTGIRRWSAPPWACR
jgi:hypothetical protein